MKGVLIWAAVCLILCGIGAYFVQKDIVTTGTDIELVVSDSRTISIRANEEVTFEGASSSFFMLYQKNGNSITAKSTEPPLGWFSDTYYTTGPQKMDTGVWSLEREPQLFISQAHNPLQQQKLFLANRLFGLWQSLSRFCCGSLDWLSPSHKMYRTRKHPLAVGFYSNS